MRLFIATLMSLAVLGLGTAQAATITVSTTEDETTTDGDCSLQEAISTVNNGSEQDNCVTSGTLGTDDTINIPDGTYTLTSGDLDITVDVTITGESEAGTIIASDGTNRVFEIDNASGANGNSVSISDLTIQDGSVSVDGGNIRNNATLRLENVTIKNGTASTANGGGIAHSANADSLTLINCTVTGNSADYAGGIGISAANATIINSTISENSATAVAGQGGGIGINDGDVEIVASTISSNSAGYGGGIADMIGLSSGGFKTLINVTLSSNAAVVHGGGIYNNNTAEIDFVTITNNEADSDDNGGGDGGGIYTTSSGTTEIANSIVAGNEDSQSAGSYRPDCDNDGTLTSYDHNILGVESGCSSEFNGANDQSGDAKTPLDAKLGSLADNGGDTQTHALQEDSPALDLVSDGNCRDPDGDDVDQDQRGTMRPSDGDHDGTALCDAGAFEVACGDGVTQSFNDEECDDGNTDDGDGCSSTCKDETEESEEDSEDEDTEAADPEEEADSADDSNNSDNSDAGSEDSLESEDEQSATGVTSSGGCSLITSKSQAGRVGTAWIILGLALLFRLIVPLLRGETEHPPAQ